ncbi:MAG: hypothetical protein M3N98_01520 [Actinomycetota bacterium]|nr:hypothetical protein [Actinomycetota bacterium]
MPALALTGIPVGLFAGLAVALIVVGVVFVLLSGAFIVQRRRALTLGARSESAVITRCKATKGGARRSWARVTLGHAARELSQIQAFLVLGMAAVVKQAQAWAVVRIRTHGSQRGDPADPGGSSPPISSSLKRSWPPGRPPVANEPDANWILIN